MENLEQLIEDFIKKSSLFSCVEVHKILESTNTYLLKNNFPSGCIVIADQQTAGRGRRGRSWFSPPGKNLYFSFLLVNPPLDPSTLPRLNIVMAVAVAEALGKLGIKTSVKWPNDILINGKKLAGILIESVFEKDKIKKLVIGTGININTDHDDFTTDILTIATSLKIATGQTWDRNSILLNLLKNIELWYNVFEKGEFYKIRDKWLQYFEWKGKEVFVSSDDTTIFGIAAGIDENGFLILSLPDGSEMKIISGDVSVRRKNATGN